MQPYEQLLGMLLHSSGRVEEKLNRLTEMVQRYARAETRRDERLMAKVDTDLDTLVAAAEAEDTKIDSIIALVQTMVQPLGLNAEQQAKLDRAIAAISDNPDRIQAAIDAVRPPIVPSGN